MAKWQIIEQESGITNTMRINILNTLRTSIDTHGSSKKYEICQDVKNWLQETYGKHWSVIIDNSSSESTKMAKWQIIEQAAGITDTMRINILNTLRISIDTHGSLKTFEICKDVNNWLDESYGKHWCVIIESTKMAKWQIIRQNPGITNTMRIDILNALRISIDTHGSSEKYEICQDVKSWLDETYGEYWCVMIGKHGEWSSCLHYYGGRYLEIKEVDLSWTIEIFQQAA
ncbi:unnamed protein product [Adineta steineri]|uniref:Uncharacterized protein n=1 Tax=Adineta steineri TaxID=433720 RepID=A0A819N3R3_9BILA|nr:unnamed protein product [Adineta steineri]